MTRITANERREIGKRSKQREERLRWRYPEVHGKVVDFITIPSMTERCTSRSASRTRRAFVSATPATCSPLELTSAIGGAETST
jgi:hypothetical protein